MLDVILLGLIVVAFLFAGAYARLCRDLIVVPTYKDISQ